MELKSHIAKRHGFKKGSNLDNFCKQFFSIPLITVVPVELRNPNVVSLGENKRSGTRHVTTCFSLRCKDPEQDVVKDGL
jgi:hypothetical protein